ncbi:chromosome segregation protein SMC [Bacillus aquiflavi]|uniref:Chromosome partition protein Smc n=1 Tax=Bacillus aquiflavi TaxID=2672567 RepID=A0A6B3VZR8_9BACI|nr:chromosome segregation protein SMC [Bacillus aquiflavi]MBA4538114.1 chromosome segregation protein SMC [Bacillus aquiflavi]NEY82412.1 chromosome segregation protein SMC [Bacillus aquiflavi]
MFLKRLEIIGFKSFAKRTEIDFVPGVTAVVGPNGSGKSNITDAIRWVLGEQSVKSLRGAKMEDIIFSGSDSRKGLNFAEVTLILQNDDQFLPVDFHEVSVTRRVYRTGESEFYINKQPCRLKDIVDLFLDSGLGREAFSIISQGKVEEILNSKAEDRRTIFEEAAGVLKYKNRKKTAETKLTETQDNLNRVNDILHELEAQVEPLKRQASIANEYIEKKAGLEKIEVALTVVEIEDLHQRWEQLSKQLDDYIDQEVKLSATIHMKEARTEELRTQMSVLDESINSLQTALLNVSEELEKLEGRKQVLKERKKNAVQNKDQLEKTIHSISEKISLFYKQKQEQQLTANSLEEEIALLKKELDEKNKQLALFSENIEEQIDSLKSDYIEQLNKQANAKNELHYLHQQIEQLSIRSSKLDNENKKYLHERKEINGQRKELQQSLERLQCQLQEQVIVYKKEQHELELLKNRYQKQETNLYKAYQFLQQTKSRKEMLEELEEDYAGFYQGVREILKARKSKLIGIHGAIAELIQVPKAYKIAIETALGGAMQHIVVETEKDARKAIQYLQHNSFGRATFLPLSVIKEKTLTSMQFQMITNHPSFIGIANKLIQYDKQFASVVSNLLGTVVITNDLKGANDLAKLLNYRSRIVTLDGNVVNPGGSMTGGALKQQSSSLLSRKVELKDIKDKLVGMEEKTAKLEDDVKTLKKDVQAQEQKIESLRKNGEELRLQEQSCKGKIREIEIEQRNINERLTLYDLEKGQFHDDIQTMESRRLELAATLSQTEKEIAYLDNQITLLTAQKNNNLTTKEELSTKAADLKVHLTAKKEQLNHCRERIDQLSAEIRENEEKVSVYKEDLQYLCDEMKNSSSGENSLEDTAAKKRHDKNATIQQISSRRQERFDIQVELEQLELEVKELKRQHKGMIQILKDEEVKLNRLDVELDNKLAHLREEYLLTFEGAKEQYPLTMEVEKARQKVKLIKLSIDELGTVNLGAIDEYNRVSERFEFLLAQKNDLEEAKDTLFQVIDEMDEEVKKRFVQTFSDIRLHFEAVFQTLFGGGRADLQLTDPNNLLTTGVEIVAQPPGKKLQNLSLLSGGERALTAIVLLFSILKVRPVPFCVLDEVEAALDEANVQRFSQYLKRYSSETQFIVITHRKGTMEEADVLYGITMQESGVSKLVSVRLEDTKELVKSS